MCLLELIASDDSDLAVEIAEHAVDTIDRYIQDLEDMSPFDLHREERIRDHPLMHTEVRTQLEDLELIRNDTSPEVISRLRRTRRDPPRSSIGLPG